MRFWGNFDQALRELVILRGRELTLRLAILLGPALFLVALHSVATTRGFLVVIAALLAVLTVLQPDAEGAIVTTVLLIFLWWAGVQQPYTIWTLVAALSLLLFHVTTTASARAPLGGRLPAGSLLRWVVRTSVVALVTAAAYGLGAVFSTLDVNGQVVLTSVAGLAVLAGTLAVRQLSLARDESPS